MGWNSWDSYGGMLNETNALANLESLAKDYQPAGYDHFVIDIGWYKAARPIGGQQTSKHLPMIQMDGYGVVQPSRELFPNGFGPIIARCHELGLKFGLHLMRGIPRQAVALNLPIKGTNFTAKDISNTKSRCFWCNYNYGVDMTRAGAQEYYDSVIAELAGWGADFIKYDNIVPYPKEIGAVGKAIEKCGRPITLSLSPGTFALKRCMPIYKRYAHTVRVTEDIWDNWQGIKKCFRAWKRWQGWEQPGFWLDLDMIPFGQLQLQKPLNAGKPSNPLQARLLGRDYARNSKFTDPEKVTFITMRALAATPLMIGGDLPTMDELSHKILTEPAIIECNRVGQMGTRVSKNGGIQIWKVESEEKKGAKKGWVGIFNLRNKEVSRTYVPKDLGIRGDPDFLTDVWNKKKIDYGRDFSFSIDAHGCIFLKYQIN